MRRSITIEVSEDKPILSEPWSKRKISIKNEELINAFLNSKTRDQLFKQLSFLGILPTLTEIQVNEIEHWEKRNWELSLDYYLWSSTDHFLDEDINFQDVISKVVTSYIEKDGLPDMPLCCTPDHAIPLPNPAEIPAQNLGEILKKRASVPATPRRPLSLEILSAILWYGLQEVRFFRTLDINEDPLNATKSFGWAFDVFLCAYNVAGMTPGIYLYDISMHAIQIWEEVKEDKLRQLMFSCQFDQKAPLTANFCLLLTAHFPRYQWRYRHEEGLSSIYTNSGQIINPLVLLATAYDLKTHISPAISDTALLNLLHLSPYDYQGIYAFSGG